LSKQTYPTFRDLNNLMRSNIFTKPRARSAATVASALAKKLAEVKDTVGDVGTLTVGAYLQRSQSSLFTGRMQYGDTKAIYVRGRVRRTKPTRGLYRKFDACDRRCRQDTSQGGV
jgi:hypothetical protein